MVDNSMEAWCRDLKADCIRMLNGEAGQVMAAAA